ncbi:MAG TPA: hypothetical protein VLE19_00925 [Pyrinomonadaceae bacterium]|nr:hypothetical protein [Pyrinomonadaceae bacterium]
MKRCPECEFIYEDDQSLCDMDGILLVFDSQQLPKQVHGTKTQLRSRIVPAIAVLVLTTVLTLVYYVSTHQRRVSPEPYTSGSLNTTKPAVSEDLSSTTVPESKAAPTEVPPASKVKPVATKPVPSSTKEQKKPERSKETANQTQRSPVQPPENDSKIESFMKKTGRFLKKPFKL